MTFPGREDLPKAAEDIASHAEALELGDDQGHVQLERATEAPGGRNGYVRTYEKGIIYWNEGIAYAVNGQIAEYYATVGGSGGVLGLPLTRNATFAESQHGAKGTEQRFEGGIVCSSNLGTYAVFDQFVGAYKSVGGVKGRLGFPTSISQPYDSAKIQRFEGGVIYSSTYGAFPVREAVAEVADGWLPASNGYPYRKIAGIGAVRENAAIPGHFGRENSSIFFGWYWNLSRWLENLEVLSSRRRADLQAWPSRVRGYRFLESRVLFKCSREGTYIPDWLQGPLRYRFLLLTG